MQQTQAKKRRIKLSLDAPDAEEVDLVGDFNQWNPKMHPMKQQYDGTWSKILMLPPGRYEYKFLVDGEWQEDPENGLMITNCFGTRNSVLIVSPAEIG
jgi:1,4-alpha-glucan branching enzyme